MLAAFLVTWKGALSLGIFLGMFVGIGLTGILVFKK